MMTAKTHWRWVHDRTRCRALVRWTQVLVAGALVAMMSALTLALVPVASAQAVAAPVAVDVDLVDGGVWVTYSNGCIESRAWLVPANDVSSRFFGTHRCLPGSTGDGGYFYAPKVIRAPLSLAESERVVALVPTDGDEGYWLITTTGRVVTGGSAESLGDLAAFTLNAPVVAAAPTESGNGYYMLTGDGGVFSFGDAEFYGSVQGLVDEHVGVGALAIDHITAEVVTLATTPAGYWLVAADGAVFPFGDAAYHGSIQDILNPGTSLADITRDWTLTPNVAPGARLAKDELDKPVVGVVPSGGGTGYQMVASDGGIFTFGAAQFHGSLPGRGGSDSLAVTSDVTDSRSGYVILTEEGTVHRFGAIGRQLDPVGRPATPLTPTALPASECRPAGQQGFPFPQRTTQPIGAFNVGVLLVEFDDYRVNRDLWPMKAVQEQLDIAQNYLEAMSYGKLDVELHRTEDWISVGPLGDHIRDGRAFGISDGSADLLEFTIQRAGDDFDVTNRGLGYEALMLVFPPSWFGNGVAWIDPQIQLAGVSSPGLAWVNTHGPFDEQRTTPYTWWNVAAHELMHLPGLSDLVGSGPTLQVAPFGWGTTEYGLMGFKDFWQGPEPLGWRTGRVVRGDGHSFFGLYHVWAHQNPREMLAWHRWRFGWLEATQMVCLRVGDATVDLVPMIDPTDDIAMASVRLSDTQFLVLEHRTRLGYDADQPGVTTGTPFFFRVLEQEGVLAYVVDVTRGSSRLPVQMFGARSSLKPGEDWILGPGESRTQTFADGATVRLDVSQGPEGTMQVKMTSS